MPNTEDLKYYEDLYKLGIPEPKDVKRMVELISDISILITEYYGVDKTIEASDLTKKKGK